MNTTDEEAVKQIEALAEDAKRIAHKAITRYVYLTLTASVMRKLKDPKVVTDAAVLDLDALTKATTDEDVH